MADERKLLTLLGTARYENWHQLQLRKKALIFTGCPTPEQLTKLKLLKVDWKKFMNSLDPKIKKVVKKHDKQQSRDIKAKSKPRQKPKQKLTPMHKRKKFNDKTATQIPVDQLRKFLQEHFFGETNKDQMEHDLLQCTCIVGDGKTLQFTDALHWGTRRWVHKLAHQLGLSTRSRKDLGTGKRFVIVSDTPLNRFSSINDHSSASGVLARAGVPDTHTAFSWEMSAATVPITHTDFSWSAGSCRPEHGTGVASRADEPARPRWDLVDVDANLLHEALAGQLETHLKIARLQGIRRMVVPGVNLAQSVECQRLSSKYLGVCFATAGVHPYWAQAADCGFSDANLALLRQLAAAPGCRCVGECGLDTSDGFPALEPQCRWFTAQVNLACDLGKPLFLHERKAHQPFVATLDSFKSRLPPVLVHCFTGTREELEAYVSRGFYIGITGFICGSGQAASELRRVLAATVPLNRLMVETDAPYLGFNNCRNFPDGAGGYHYGQRKKKFPNVPAALPLVVAELAKCYGVSGAEIARVTTHNATHFFQL